MQAMTSQRRERRERERERERERKRFVPGVKVWRGGEQQEQRDKTVLSGSHNFDRLRVRFYI